jgi:hypothetical protein
MVVLLLYLTPLLLINRQSAVVLSLSSIMPTITPADITEPLINEVTLLSRTLEAGNLVAAKLDLPRAELYELALPFISAMVCLIICLHDIYLIL